MIRGRLPRRRGEGERPPSADQYVEIDPSELTGIFAAPQWLRDLGFLSWLVLGVALMVAAAMGFFALTEVIAIPVITAAIVAAVASPIVRWLERLRVPRAAGAALVLLMIVALAAGTIVLVLGGITSQADGISSHLNHAADKIANGLQDLGVDPGKAESAKSDASSSISDGFHALLNGLRVGIHALSSLAVFLAFLVLSLFFLLKDGPVIRRWGERHLGLPRPVAEVVSTRTIGSLRGYFLGVTIVGAFNALVIGLGALLIGVPLAGTIAVVTFFASYVPYLGAWSAGAFAVLIALSGGGTDAAGEMAVVAFLANGPLQQLMQPFAMSAALGIHPLAVLVVTIAGGAIFGTIGLVLAAPITSAVVRISADLARARAEQDAAEAPAPPPPEPSPPTPEPA
jgi:predicted PurR-regulated permease PerM